MQSSSVCGERFPNCATLIDILMQNNFLFGKSLITLLSTLLLAQNWADVFIDEKVQKFIYQKLFK